MFPQFPTPAHREKKKSQKVLEAVVDSILVLFSLASCQEKKQPFQRWLLSLHPSVFENNASQGPRAYPYIVDGCLFSLIGCALCF